MSFFLNGSAKPDNRTALLNGSMGRRKEKIAYAGNVPKDVGRQSQKMPGGAGAPRRYRSSCIIPFRHVCTLCNSSQRHHAFEVNYPVPVELGILRLGAFVVSRPSSYRKTTPTSPMNSTRPTSQGVGPLTETASGFGFPCWRIAMNALRFIEAN